MEEKKIIVAEPMPPEGPSPNFVAPFLAAVAVVVVCAAVYFSVMATVKKMEKRVVAYLSESMDAEVVAKSVNINSAFRIIMTGVSAKSRKGPVDVPDIEAEKIIIAADVPSLLRGELSVKEVSFDGVVVRIYGDGSTANYENWVKGVTECDHDSFESEFPRRVNVKNGKIIVEPFPGSDMTGSFTAAGFEGSLGMTKDGALGLTGALKASGSTLDVSGGFKPCANEDVDFRASSPAFDFGGFKDLLKKAGVRNAEKSKIIPSGGGKLNVRISGSITDMYVEGSVSTRSFDSGFIFVQNTLTIRDFVAGIAGERIMGKGKVRLDQKGAPFDFNMELEGIRLGGIVGKSLSQDYVPEGSVSGAVNFSGFMNSSDVVVNSGRIVVENGKILLPVPETGFNSAAGRRISILSFNRLEGALSSEDGTLKFTDVKIDGDGWSGEGAVSVNSILPSTYFQNGRAYSISMKIESERSKELFDLAPGFEGKIGGALTAEFNIKGVVGSRDSYRGDGSASIRNGFMRNPYEGMMMYGTQYIDFDYASVDFEVYGETFELRKFEVNGDGLDIEGNGSISFAGALNIDAKARFTPERAADFPGISLFPQNGAVSDLVTYSAKCEIYGTLMNPASIWSKPSITRWQ